MSKFSLLVIGGAVGLLCSGSPAAMAQAMAQNATKTDTSETKSPVQVPNEGEFTYNGKNTSGQMLTLKVTWKSLSQIREDGNAPVSGGAKYNHPETKMDSVVYIDEKQSYLTKEGKLFVVFTDFNGKIFGPIDVVELERKRVEASKKNTNNSSNKTKNNSNNQNSPRTTGDKTSSKTTQNPGSNLENEETLDDDLSSNSLSSDNPPSTNSGSFDDVLRFGKFLLPVSVNWRTVEPIKNGFAKIKGDLILVGNNGISNPGLELTNSYLKDGRIHYSSPKLGRSFTSPRDISNQYYRVRIFSRAINRILSNKGKKLPSLKAPYESVDPLSGALYQALLDYGVANFKYGRSENSVYIRRWLTIALDPKKTGDKMSVRVANVLDQLGVDIKPGKVLNVALRPIEKTAAPKSMAGDMVIRMANPNPHEPFMVAGLVLLGNLLDYPISRFCERVNNMYNAILAGNQRGGVPEPLTPTHILNRLGLNTERQNVAAQVVEGLAHPGYLAREGLNDVQQRRLAREILLFWQHLELAEQPSYGWLRDGARVAILDYLEGLMNRNGNRARDAANLIVDRLMYAPVRNRAIAVANVNMLIGIRAAINTVNPPDAGSSTNAGSICGVYDDSKRDDDDSRRNGEL